MNANTKKKLSDNMIWLVLVVLVIIMSIANPKFFTIANLRTLLTGESIKGIMAFGVAFAILTKGIDLSIGASAALIACVTGALVQPVDLATKALANFGVQVPAIAAILLGMVMGVIIGALQGLLIAYTKMPAFIATLGGQLICRAAAKILHHPSGIQPVRRLPLAGKRHDRPDPGNRSGIPDCLCSGSLHPGTDPFRENPCMPSAEMTRQPV